MSGATSGSSASRSVERSTSMYATHLGVARGPDRPQRAAAALLLEPDDADAGQLGGESCGDQRRGVLAGVVGDGDPPREGEPVAEVGVQPVDAGPEVDLLVVHRDDDVDGGSVAVVPLAGERLDAGHGCLGELLRWPCDDSGGASWDGSARRLCTICERSPTARSQPASEERRAPATDPAGMTLTTAAWICLVAAAGTTAVRALRRRPAPCPRARSPAPGRTTSDWHPHVTSGCGR